MAARKNAASPTTYVALLRAVNLGPHNRIGKDDLRALAERLGYGEARTLLASGNLVFSGPAARERGDVELERALEAEAAKRLGLHTDFFVRSAAHWAELVAANPFPAKAKRDPGHLVAMCLKEAPAAGALEALRAAIAAVKGPELVELEGRCAYVVYPEGIGRSKVTLPLIEKKLGTRGTGRNWNTVLKLAAMCGGSG